MGDNKKRAIGNIIIIIMIYTLAPQSPYFVAVAQKGQSSSNVESKTQNSALCVMSREQNDKSSGLLVLLKVQKYKNRQKERKIENIFGDIDIKFSL